MKKTLLAAALTVGFFGVAQAETSVTLYGVVDTGIGYNKVEVGNYEAKKVGLINGVQSGSRWGLKGTEDLGDGLQAIFQVESGFDSSTGFSGQGGRLMGRHATIGLQGESWGRLDLGRQTNIASKYFADVASPFGASFGQANVGATFGSSNTVRWDNMVMYQTPNFSGFQFGVGYSFNTNGAQDWDIDGEDDANNKGITTGLRYANGPIGAALTYDQIKRDARSAAAAVPATPGNAGTAAVTAQGSQKVQQWNLGLSYDFEVVKLHAGFGQTKDGWIAGQSFGEGAPSRTQFVEGLEANLYTVGVSAPLGAGKVMASWAMADFDDLNGVDLDKQSIYSLGYTYALSKRTNFYAYGSYADNVYGLDDAKSTAVGVGIRHQF
ncbi:porin [Alcaligenaceae bacterium]|nr:porin [Alcaligenaceae bacterium]